MGVSYIGGSGQTFSGSVDTVYCIQPQGLQGTNGSQGTQGTNGSQGTQGLQGTLGLQGIQGLQGLLGTGAQGTQGVSGGGNTSIVVAEGSMSVRAGLPRYINGDLASSSWVINNTGNVNSPSSVGLGWSSSTWTGNIPGAAIVSGLAGTADLFWLATSGIILNNSYQDGDSFTYRATWTSEKGGTPFSVPATGRIAVALFRWKCSNEVSNGLGEYELISNISTSNSMTISNLGSDGRAQVCMNSILTINGVNLSRFDDRLIIAYATDSAPDDTNACSGDLGCTWKLIEGADAQP